MLPASFIYAELVIPAFGGLCAAIVYLWRDVKGQYRDTRAQHKKCEEGLAEANKNFAELKEDFGVVKGRQEGIERLSQQVIDEVRSIKMRAGND